MQIQEHNSSSSKAHGSEIAGNKCITGLFVYEEYNKESNKQEREITIDLLFKDK